MGHGRGLHETESPASLDSFSKSKGEGDEITDQLAILLRICQVSPGDTAGHRSRGPGRERERKKLLLLLPRLSAFLPFPLPPSSSRGPFLRPNYPSLFTKISATKFAPVVKTIDSSYVVIELLGH